MSENFTKLIKFYFYFYFLTEKNAVIFTICKIILFTFSLLKILYSLNKKSQLKAVSGSIVYENC